MYEDIGGGRVEITDRLTESEVLELIQLETLHTIQFSDVVSQETFMLLEAHLFSKRDDIVLRAHSFDFARCDLSNLAYVPSVRRLYVDVDRRITNLNVIHQLRSLTELVLHVYRLESLDILDGVTEHLIDLSIGATKSTKPDLSVISRFSRLKRLRIEGHTKGIDVLRRLPQLEELTLRSVRLHNFSCLGGLEKLTTLNILLGGTRDLTALSSLKALQHLGLRHIRGLEDLSVISELLELRTLHLQSLRRVQQLPDVSKLYHLKRIEIEHLQGLINLSSLGEAPSLRQFSHFSAKHMQFKDYVPLLENPIVEEVVVDFGSVRRNDEFTEMMNQYGKVEISDWD